MGGGGGGGGGPVACIHKGEGVGGVHEYMNLGCYIIRYAKIIVLKNHFLNHLCITVDGGGGGGGGGGHLK